MYVNKALAGAFRFACYRYVIKEKVLCPHCYNDLPQHSCCGNHTRSRVVVEATREERINWGRLYRALKRLYAYGHIRAFTLRRTGQLSVVWTYEKPAPSAPKPKVPHLPLVFISTIAEKDIRLDHAYTHLYMPKDPHVARKLPDIVPQYTEVMEEHNKAQRELHSPESIERRAREFTQNTPGACASWSIKFKLYPEYYGPPVEKRTREEIINASRRK